MGQGNKHNNCDDHGLSTKRAFVLRSKPLITMFTTVTVMMIIRQILL